MDETRESIASLTIRNEEISRYINELHKERIKNVKQIREMSKQQLKENVE